MPFQVNHSVYHPKGSNGESKLANNNAWVMISKEKITRRLEDNSIENPPSIITFLVSMPREVYKLRNVWYRFIL